MKKLKATNRATVIFMIGFIILFLVLFGRILFIQASGEIEGVNLNDWADKQRTTSYQLPAERGQILDRTGMVLADNRPVYRLYAILDEEYTVNEHKPLHVKDPEKTAIQLAPYLNLEVSSLSELLKDSIEQGKFQIEFTTTNFTAKEKEEIEALGLPGVYFTKFSERYYPNGEFAAHLIGFTKKEEESEAIVGAMGIESAFDEQLTGKNGEISFKRDRYANKLLDPEEIIVQAQDGDHVYLTIDQKIQTFLEDAMSDVALEYDPEKIMAVVMNPKTGEILAMSNRPSFDPNTKENIQNWYNDIVAYPFEPGSTMKIFTIAAAIDSGNYNGNEIYESGTYKYMDNVRPVHDHNWGKGWDWITYDEGFQRSSNVAMAKLVWEKMGTETFLEYLQRFDFDKETGIDLTGEIKGTILYNWPSEKVTTSYGQGTTVTPIQLMKAATAVANDGKMMKPYVISKVIDSSTGDVINETKPELVSEPITPETASHVMDLLESVVTEEEGTGQTYHLDDYTVAGKTGTAQIPDPDGGYLTGDRENYIFSFLGMAPADDPELMMFVAVKQPKLTEQDTGSQPVSYIFKTVMENSLRYLEIQPDKESEESVEIDTVTLQDYTGKSVESVKQLLQEKSLELNIIGSGNKVKTMIPNNGSKVIPGSSVLILTDGKPNMPNIEGWSLREVLQLGQLLDIEVNYEGSGFVINQSIEPGVPITDQTLIVNLQPPGQEDSEIDKEESQIEE